ncbi:radiation-inducible immediate-early gene IEX-1 [Spinachia spinachia]
MGKTVDHQSIGRCRCRPSFPAGDSAPRWATRRRPGRGQLLRDQHIRCERRAATHQTPSSSMYSRSNSVTLTVPREPFARSTEPEVFTFERIPTQASAVLSYVPIRPRKRCTRVMYPAKVRMHLPPPERSPAKRWLLVLCLVVLWQIYTEEPCGADPLAPGSADGPVSVRDFQSYSYPPAEEQQRAERGPGLLSTAPAV